MMHDEIVNHIKAIDQWLEHLRNTYKPPAGLSIEERKQLQSVNKAIEQLQRAKVSVPEDLRRIKLDLSARDIEYFHDDEIETRLNAVENLINRLGKTIQTAKVFRDRLKSKGQVRPPKKSYGVTLEDLLKAGVLSTNDQLELQWLKGGPVLKGRIGSDGKVLVKTPDGWKSYASLSTAASLLAGRSLNGWKHWCRIGPSGKSTALEDVRARHLKEEADG